MSAASAKVYSLASYRAKREAKEKEAALPESVKSHLAKLDSKGWTNDADGPWAGYDEEGMDEMERKLDAYREGWPVEWSQADEDDLTQRVNDRREQLDWL